MPVRIYDIAKKYGLENKQILEKAKALGIAAAKVPSSSLDKISAGWLEEELIKQYPELASKVAQPPVPEKPKPAPVDEEIKIISAPPPPPPPPPPVPEPPAPAPVAPEVKAEPPALSPPPPPIPAAEKPKPVTPPPPPPKPAPKVGEKVGFIQLPTRPQQPPRGDRGATGKMPPHRPGAPPPRREEQRERDGAHRDGRPQPPREGAKPATPAAPKFAVPETGEIITIKPPIVVRDLANALKQKPFIIIGDLMKLGVFATVNQAIDEKIARQICAKYGFRFEVEKRERGAGVVHATEKKVELDLGQG